MLKIEKDYSVEFNEHLINTIKPYVEKNLIEIKDDALKFQEKIEKDQIAEQIGEPESILLNQIDYWLSKNGKTVDNLNGQWIYNSHKEWLKQFSYWSLSKLRRTIKSLETLGLIISVKVNYKKWNQTKWYTINYEKYDKLFKNKSLRSSNPKLSVIEEEQSINKSDCLVDYSVLNMDYSNLRHSTENKINKSENNSFHNI